MNKSLDGNSYMWYKITGIKMFENSLSDWRKILLVREEPLCGIFVLSPEDLKNLPVSEELGAPSFIRRLSKRWCL